MTHETEVKEPLYKVLNEQRTQGEVKVDMGKNIILWANNGLSTRLVRSEILVIPSVLIGEENNDYHISRAEAKVNSEYTALAVNNLAMLADTIDESSNRIAYCIDLYNLPEEATAMLRGEIDALNSALKAIS